MVSKNHCVHVRFMIILYLRIAW